MDEILDQLEQLIDDVERDSQITKEEILLTLREIKEEVFDYITQREEGLQWDDLDQ